MATRFLSAQNLLYVSQRFGPLNPALKAPRLQQQQQPQSCRFATTTGGRSSSSRPPRGSKERGSLQERRRRHKKKSRDNDSKKKNNSQYKTTNLKVKDGGDKAAKSYTPWKEDPVKYKEYRKIRYIVMAQRAAPLVAFGILVNMTEEGSIFFHNYLFPLQMEQLYGPSMVPSIHPYGDSWLHTTPMWDSVRSIYHTLYNMISSTPSLLYNKGEIVIWKDPTTHRRACKRVVGVAGDTIQRYGQFAEYYSHRSDVGVPWEAAAGLGARGLDPTCPWDNNIDKSSRSEGAIIRRNDQESFSEKNDNTSATPMQKRKPFADDEIYRTLVIPEGHVWLEGDNPLLSVDSRHYGPIPVPYLEGRLVWRLWPLLRHPVIRKHDQLLLRHRMIRPQPLDLETPKQRGQEDRLALYYNLHRATSSSSPTDPTSSDPDPDADPSTG